MVRQQSMIDEQTSGRICHVSVMVFTLNEELHLPGCLAALAWCDDVIVVDSFSTDRTFEICERDGARFFQNLDPLERSKTLSFR